MAPIETISKPKDDAVSKKIQDELTIHDESEGARQIPEVVFIDNVEEVCNTSGHDPTAYVGALQDLHSKFKYSESTLQSQKSGVRIKLPDIQAAYDLVKFLVDKRDASQKSVDMTYQLSENIYASAEIPTENNMLMLWLGANVMLEYTYDEALELLGMNLANAKEQLETIKVDLEFVREQIVTSEVNIARCHNHGVLLRQQEREAEEAKKAKDSPEDGDN